MISSRNIPEDIRSRISNALDEASEELRTNERLKWIITGGVVILYLTFVGYCASLSGQAKELYSSNKMQLSILKSQTSETAWPERATQAEHAAIEFNKQFWPGNTTGLAEAGFERWIRQGLEKYGTEVRQVLLTRNPANEDSSLFGADQLSGVLRIRAKVIGPLDEAALLQFLHDAGTYEHWVVVEQLILRDGRNPRFEMDLATFSKTGGTL